MARISSLDVLPWLLTLAAGQTARLLNVANLASPFQLSHPTIRDYVTLLARVFFEAYGMASDGISHRRHIHR
jgi:predicted AAA+ superfamily ATPase